VHEQKIRPIASDFEPELLGLFDLYVHGLVDRRNFLERAAKFAGAGVTATGLLEALNPKFAQAQQISPGDERLQAEFVELPSANGNGKVRGYLVRPKKASGKLPAVLVALENFLAFAPDALFTLGGYPGDEDQARELFQKLDKTKTVEDFVASERYLRTHVAGNGRVGVVGFCYGGGIAHTLATRLPDLDAAVPFYGSSPAPELASHVKAELLIHLAATDERTNASFPAYEAALIAAKVKFAAHTYPGTQHGFHNDTTPRYDEAAAKLAWSRTLELFERTLRTAKSSPGAAHQP
jgi:carboxymethylenebutenolidase